MSLIFRPRPALMRLVAARRADVASERVVGRRGSRVPSDSRETAGTRDVRRIPPG